MVLVVQIKNFAVVINDVSDTDFCCYVVKKDVVNDGVDVHNVAAVIEGFCGKNRGYY